MKQVIIAVAMLAGVIAQADLGSRTYEAQLTNINMDQKLFPKLGPLEVTDGTINLDYSRKVARLTLYRQFFCPDGLVCALSMPAPIVIELPILSQSTDRCGNKVVYASDGMSILPVMLDSQRTLTIVDHRKNRCPTFDILPETSVQLEYSYTVYEPMVYRVDTYSTMSGKGLLRVDDQF